MAWSDSELVQRTLNGDRDAFGRLVERHRRTIFVLMLQSGYQQAEADDLAQEVFVKAFKSLNTLVQPESFSRWLYGIAGHVAADAVRSRKSRSEAALESDPDLRTLQDEPCAGFSYDSIDVVNALSELPHDQRLVLTLRYLEGLTPKQIAERLSEPRGTVRSRLHHALSYLQSSIGARAKSQNRES